MLTSLVTKSEIGNRDPMKCWAGQGWDLSKRMLCSLCCMHSLGHATGRSEVVPQGPTLLRGGKLTSLVVRSQSTVGTLIHSAVPKFLRKRSALWPSSL